MLDSSRTRMRGGLFLGTDVNIAVIDRLSLAPEFRVVYGGPARVGSKYREVSFGAKATWAF